jgi:hypothetical protein
VGVNTVMGPPTQKPPHLGLMTKKMKFDDVDAAWGAVHVAQDGAHMPVALDATRKDCDNAALMYSLHFV